MGKFFGNITEILKGMETSVMIQDVIKYMLAESLEARFLSRDIDVKLRRLHFINDACSLQSDTCM
jgi:hypothetical protein